MIGGLYVWIVISEKRIKAMIDYADTDDKCRSRMLLYYFGEKNEHNCGQCDVCLKKHESGLRLGVFEDVRDEIFRLLESEGSQTPKQLVQSVTIADKDAVQEVLSFLMSENQIEQTDGKLHLTKSIVNSLKS